MKERNPEKAFEESLDYIPDKIYPIFGRLKELTENKVVAQWR